MTQVKRVLVYGATGPQQRPVAERLLAAGFSVRVLVRNPASAEALEKKGAEVVQGDLSEPTSLARATKGVDAVSLFVPFMNPRLEFGLNALEAARKAGVRRVVWNPTGAIPPGKVGHPGMDVRVELRDRLLTPDFDAVIIEPTGYLENFLMPALVDELKTRNTFAYPMPRETKVQWITHEDVAQFLVKALQTPTLSRTSLAVSGPEHLTGDLIAAAMSRALERRIEFRPMPPREFGDVLDRAIGPGAGAQVVGFYESVFANPASFSSNVDLEAALALLPIQPTTVEAWARAKAALLT